MPGVLPDDLAARAADPLAWRQTLAHLSRQSLARIDHRGLLMHRLTQAILRDRLTPGQAAATRARTEAILAASDPGDPDNPATWPRWERLMPHLLAATWPPPTTPACASWPATHAATCSPAAIPAPPSTSPATCASSGATGSAPITSTRWRSETTSAGRWRRLGRCAQARDLAQDTLDRRRRILGQDHPDTLATANDLASNLSLLGEVRAARDLDQDTLDRRRRVLGEDHPDTLHSASHLAADLRALGELQAARDLAPGHPGPAAPGPGRGPPRHAGLRE